MNIDMEPSGSFAVWVEHAISYAANPSVWLSMLWVLVKIILYYAAGRLVVRVAARAAAHIASARRSSRAAAAVRIDPRRKQTIGKLFHNIAAYTVNFIVILLILAEFGVELAPLLAGAGVLGLAVGFGAQSLVKDVITGFFIIFEDQFAVGDVIKTGAFQGTVEEIGLRTTRIRSFTGEVHILPNGSIASVTNYSVANSLGIVDVSVPYDSDIEKAAELVRQAAEKVCEEHEDAVGMPEVLGVQTIGAQGVVLRITFECRPLAQHTVGRQLIAAVKKALDEEEITAQNPRLVTFQSMM